MSSTTYNGAESATYLETTNNLQQYVEVLSDMQNYTEEKITSLFAQTKSALGTMQNDNGRGLNMSDMFNETPVGTYGRLPKCWPDLLLEAQGVEIPAGATDEAIAVLIKDAGKATTAQRELAVQLQIRDIAATGPPNGALRAVMDFIEKTLPKRVWDHHFNQAGVQNLRKKYLDVDLYQMSQSAIKGAVAPGTETARDLLKQARSPVVQLSNTPRDCFKRLADIVLALQSLHHTDISVSAQVTQLLHQIENYARNTKALVFEQVVADFHKQFPVGIGDLYGETHLEGLQTLIIAADDLRRRAATYSVDDDTAWELQCDNESRAQGNSNTEVFDQDGVLTALANMPSAERHAVLRDYRQGDAFDAVEESSESALAAELAALKKKHRGRSATPKGRRSRSPSRSPNKKPCKFCIGLGMLGTYCRSPNDELECWCSTKWNPAEESEPRPAWLLKKLKEQAEEEKKT